MTTDIIGIDCSTDGRNVGLAYFSGTTGGVEALEHGLRDPAGVVEGWIGGSHRALLALDAPLGWPAAFEELASHRAGAPLQVSRGEAFNRETDRFVKRVTGQQPLRVGADRIAMTAHWALDLLAEIRRRTSEPVPLAWTPEFQERIAAIEVYPAATLRSCGLPCSGYKGDEARHVAARTDLIASLGSHLKVRDVLTDVLRKPDLLDAAICCLAGTHFLNGEAHPPENRELATNEGWIWVCRGSAR